MSDFWEAYKHPLWQQMRLRIYERDGFRCQECFARDRTLHAHHKYYRRRITSRGSTAWMRSSRLNIGEMSRVANRRIATKQVAQALDLIDGIEPT